MQKELMTNILNDPDHTTNLYIFNFIMNNFYEGFMKKE